jgi:hypothetical protein
MTYTTEGRELGLYGVNGGSLYRQNATPVIENLARKIAAGTYHPALAVQAFRFWAESAARAYVREFSANEPGEWCAMFPPMARLEAARYALAHYSEQIEDRAQDLKAQAENRRRWTLSAIRAANADSGRFFFSRDTMRFFGDTMKSWTVDYNGPRIFVVRVKPSRDLDGRLMKDAGERREFDPTTGEIGSPIRAQVEV